MTPYTGGDHSPSADSRREATTGACGEDAVRSLFRGHGDAIDMDDAAAVLTRTTVYRGWIFSVDDMRIALARHDGGRIVINRQLVRHPPCVVMLVHDVNRDAYLVEREYRVGSGIFTVGLPAGLMEPHEEERQAALRELGEETGIDASGDASISIDKVGDYYSSEGMADELAHIMVIHLRRWSTIPTHFDEQEHIQSAWVSWDTLQSLPVTASNSIIAIQHEALCRLRADIR
jgi:ADP-ribose pyrophosphatase